MIKARIIVYIHGGVFAGALADRGDIEVMIVDYDNEKVGESRADRTFEPVEVDAAYFKETVQGIEDLLE